MFDLMTVGIYQGLMEKKLIFLIIELEGTLLHILFTATLFENKMKDIQTLA